MTSLADGPSAAGGHAGGGTAIPVRLGPAARAQTDGVPAVTPSTGPPSDLELLRTYEPVLRYTAGELFLPTSVEAYLARCSLWADDGGSRRRAPSCSCRPAS